MSRVGYLMSNYPAVSHAFVVREIESLRDAGVEVHTLSIHRTDRTQLLAVADRAEADRTFNVLPIAVGSLLTAHLVAFARAPRRYLATLALALRTGAPGVRERIWHAFYFGEAMVVVRQVRRAGISHIHAQFADGATDVAMLVSHYLGDATSWSLAVHGSVEFYNVIRYGLATKLAHATFARAISDFGRSQLMTMTPPDRWSHIHVVRCGVNPDVYVPPAHRSASICHAEILCVGRLLPGKGLSLLLESAAALIASGLDVRVRLVGDGPARHALEHDVQRLGLAERVTFTGAIGQDQLVSVYEQADIFCLPSFAEGIPVVAMEAMAMELPVVTTRIAGVPELVEDRVDGILVTPGRVDELTEALHRLVVAPELRRRLGVAGRVKVRALYDVRACAMEMRAVLEREIGLRATGRESDMHAPRWQDLGIDDLAMPQLEHEQTPNAL